MQLFPCMYLINLVIYCRKWKLKNAELFLVEVNLNQNGIIWIDLDRLVHSRDRLPTLWLLYFSCSLNGKCLNSQNFIWHHQVAPGSKKLHVGFFYQTLQNENLDYVVLFHYVSYVNPCRLATKQKIDQQSWNLMSARLQMALPKL